MSKVDTAQNLETLIKILMLLEKLPQDERQRILSTIVNFYGISLPEGY